VEHLLRRRTPALADTPACADPETLAAWVDGGLDAQAMAETELHLSNCARCQAMLAAIARSEPDAPTAVPWWSRLQLRWLVPMTAAAAAAVLWMVVPGSGPRVPIAEPETMQARADRSDAADAPVPTPAPSVGGAATKLSPPAATATPAAPPAPGGQRVPGPTDNGARQASAAAGLDQSAAPEAREEALAEGKALAKQQPADTLARSNERESMRDTVSATGAAPTAEAPRAAGAVPAPPPPAAVAAGAPAGFESSGTVIPTRDGVARWRLTAPAPAGSGARQGDTGTVDRSDDGGATWQRISTGIQRRFTAGAAPSAAVCWLVGPGGTVALTIDARTWRQLPAPAPDADLTSVEAGDARTATVRDRQGRTFRTTDGGATWAMVP
jgi:hypothetical protein